MTVRQYIGARYVPVFSDPIQWDSTVSYEPLTVVMNEGTSYVSKQSVPAGIQITNETYWLRWADYNAQLEEYIRQVTAYTQIVNDISDSLPSTDFSAQNTVSDVIENLAELLPSTDFSAQNTVSDVIENLAELLPSTDFSAQNTVSDVIASFENTVNGTIQEMETRLNNTISGIFDTVADMVQTTLESGYVKTLAYYGNGSGGAFYKIEDTPGDVNILLNNGKYANLIYDENNLYISQFGVGNDPNGDDAAHVQKAFDVLANEAGVINFDVPAVYLKTQVVIRKKYSTLKGHRTSGYTTEIYTDDNLQYAIKVVTNGLQIDGMFFHMNGVIDYSGTNPPRNTAIQFLIDPEYGTINDVDATVFDTGFLGYETCMEMYGKNINVDGCAFTWCKRAIFNKAFAGQDSVRGIILKDSEFHTCSERLSVAVNDLTAKCWCIEVESSVPLAQLLIDGNVFSGGCYMGFYKGPQGVTISNNTSDENLGNAVGRVLLLHGSRSGMLGLVYKNNTCVWAANQGTSVDRDYYMENLISGYCWRACVANNTLALQPCEHFLNSDTSFAFALVCGNQVFGFGNDNSASSFIRSASDGNIVILGNVIRNVSANNPYFNDPNAGGYITDGTTNLKARNYIEGFSDIQ